MKKKIGNGSFRRNFWVERDLNPGPIDSDTSSLRTELYLCCIAQFVESLRRNLLGPGSNPDQPRNHFKGKTLYDYLRNVIQYGTLASIRRKETFENLIVYPFITSMMEYCTFVLNRTTTAKLYKTISRLTNTPMNGANMPPMRLMKEETPRAWFLR